MGLSVVYPTDVVPLGLPRAPASPSPDQTAILTTDEVATRLQRAAAASASDDASIAGMVRDSLTRGHAPGKRSSEPAGGWMGAQAAIDFLQAFLYR